MSGRSQTQKATYRVIQFIRYSGRGKTKKTEKYISICQRTGVGERLTTKYREILGSDKTVLYVVVGYKNVYAYPFTYTVYVYTKSIYTKNSKAYCMYIMSQFKIMKKSLKLTKRISLEDEKNNENLNYSYVSLHKIMENLQLLCKIK